MLLRAHWVERRHATLASKHTAMKDQVLCKYLKLISNQYTATKRIGPEYETCAKKLNRSNAAAVT